jgi:hypothetical protein
VIKRPAQGSNLSGRGDYLTRDLHSELMTAFGDFKWNSVRTFAEIKSIDADVMLVELEAQDLLDVIGSPRVQNVSHHIRTPVTEHLATGVQTLVRTPRGTVSPKYKFDGHQPTDIASIFTGLQARTPLVFEWAGQIDNGLAIFAVARVTERDRLYNDEPVEHYLLIRDGLDGSLIIGQQSTLPGCANAYSTWLSNARTDLRYTHKTNVDVDGVVEHLTASLDFNFRHVVEQAERMAGFYISTLDATRFFERVLLTQSATRYGGKVEAVHDIRHADNAGKELPHRKAFNRDLTTLQDCWRNGNGQTERRGLHKAFHAVTFWANHLSSNRGGVVAVTQRNTRQMMPGGNRDKIINSAFNIAMQIAA